MELFSDGTDHSVELKLVWYFMCCSAQKSSAAKFIVTLRWSLDSSRVSMEVTLYLGSSPSIFTDEMAIFGMKGFWFHAFSGVTMTPSCRARSHLPSFNLRGETSEKSSGAHQKCVL